MNSDSDINKKSNARATLLRNVGNKLYQNKKFFEALLKYNESLCYTEDDETKAISFANRSAVYMELKLYPECLHNIKLARDHKYPADKMSKLDNRESACKRLKPRARHDPFDTFKLSYKSNEKIPFVIDGLNLETDKKYGRKIITDRELKVGDIISLETPIFTAFYLDANQNEGKPENKFNFCYLCMMDNNMDLIPCDGCTTTMFCGQKCMMQAHSYHRYECTFAGTLNTRDQFTTSSFFKALSIADGSIEKLEKIFNECLETPKTVLDFDFGNPDDPEYQRNQLKVALSFARDESVQHYEFAHQVFIKNKLWPVHEKFIKKFLLHLLQAKRYTATDINRSFFLKTDTHSVGCGNVLFGALINHSCFPNLLRFDVGEKMCLAVVRPIAKGEQLFDTYIPPFHLMPANRRQLLLKYYSIECDCVACKFPDGYVPLENLVSRDPQLLRYIHGYLNIETMPHKEIQRRFNVLKTQLQNHYKPENIPSKEYQMMYYIFSFLLKLLACPNHK